MKRFTRMVAAFGLMTVAGCAGLVPGDGSAEVVFVVETPVDLGRMVFAADGGIPFELAVAGEGVTIYRQLVQPGVYCLQEVATGNLAVGYSVRIPSPICIEALAGKQVYGGHLVVVRDGIRRRKDLARLEAQLQDESIPVEAWPVDLKYAPFDPAQPKS